MKNKIKLTYLLLFLFNYQSLFCYEIIRDPIFEDYFSKLGNQLKLNEVNVYLINSKSANAFVINNNIYFTTELFDEINNEDTLKAIFFHEYGHVIKDHFHAKKIKIDQFNSKRGIYSLFSIGLAVIAGNVDIGIGTSITLNNNLVNEISKHSINYEIEADNFMINQIKENEINTIELISFLENLNNSSNSYFKTHPRSRDRINNLKELNFTKNKNSFKFDWIKSKYSNNSENLSFNKFFINLEKGIFDQDTEIDKINQLEIEYEAFKKGIFIEEWSTNFQKLLDINDSPFLKIEYINFLLDNEISEKYYLIEDLKFNKEIMNEYFYYFIYGKYYNKIKKINLSNFYFCQFYSAIGSKNKADFYCKKYDNENIPKLDKSYALFK